MNDINNCSLVQYYLNSVAVLTVVKKMFTMEHQLEVANGTIQDKDLITKFSLDPSLSSSTLLLLFLLESLLICTTERYIQVSFIAIDDMVQLHFQKFNKYLQVLLGVSLIFWSVCTVLSGFVTSYWQLAILRFGVGLG